MIDYTPERGNRQGLVVSGKGLVVSRVRNEELSASGGVLCGIFVFLDGSASLGWKGRAAVQSVNGAIPAHLYRFNPDEPERGDNLARSVFVQLKHAQTSLRASPEIQSRNRRYRVFVYRDLKV